MTVRISTLVSLIAPRIAAERRASSTPEAKHAAYETRVDCFGNVWLNDNRARRVAVLNPWLGCFCECDVDVPAGSIARPASGGSKRR